jgi:hypothetical protein
MSASDVAGLSEMAASGALECALGFLELSKCVTARSNQKAPAPYLSAKASSTRLTVIQG